MPVCVCAWACLYLVPLCLTHCFCNPPYPPLLIGAKVLQSGETFLEAIIGVMRSGWGNSKHYWTFPALGSRSWGFGPGLVQLGQKYRTLLPQRNGRCSWKYNLQIVCKCINICRFVDSETRRTSDMKGFWSLGVLLGVYQLPDSFFFTLCIISLKRSTVRFRISLNIL